MDVVVAEGPLAAIEADALCFAVADPVELPAAGRELDKALAGRLAHLVADRELVGTAGGVTLVHTLGELGCHRVVAAGLGSRDRLDADAVRTAAAKAAERAGAVRAESLAWALDDALPLSPGEQARAVVDGAALGPVDTGRWKTEGERKRGPGRLVLCGPGAAGALDAARRAALVAGWTNRCRDLVDTPANDLTPTALADVAAEFGARFEHLAVESHDVHGIRSLGMNALAAVARGSDEPPRLIVARYEPPGAGGDFVLGLVGKAITFDSGGISIKPAARMSDMKTDMGGGAAVLCALAALAELDVPIRVVAVVGACENMLSGHSSRPGDIVRAANGKTIEITNTDAEGRLVLADCLWHARALGATHLLDVATLTGGIVTALGDFYAGLFANDQAWGARVLAAAKASGDHAWPMPLHETYARFIRSAYADVANSSELKQATPVYAARFLQEFAGDGPWAHLDVAGTAHLDRGRGDYFSGEGATGYGVRLIAELAASLAADGGS
jgi:leucyl aminopeptidase